MIRYFKHVLINSSSTEENIRTIQSWRNTTEKKTILDIMSLGKKYWKGTTGKEWSNSKRFIHSGRSEWLNIFIKYVRDVICDVQSF